MKQRKERKDCQAWLFFILPNSSFLQKLQLHSSLTADSNQGGQSKARTPREWNWKPGLRVTRGKRWQRSMSGSNDRLSSGLAQVSSPCSRGRPLLNFDIHWRYPKVDTHWAQHSLKWAWVFILSAQQFGFCASATALLVPKKLPFFFLLLKLPFDSSFLNGTTYLNFRFASL